MNQRDVLLVGAGVLAGYLLVGFMNKNKANATETLPNKESQTVPPATTAGETLVDPKLTACEDKWKENLKNLRIKGAQAIALAHDAFIADCLAGK
jgi:hypothetical protein